MLSGRRGVGEQGQSVGVGRGAVDDGAGAGAAGAIGAGGFVELGAQCPVVAGQGVRAGPAPPAKVV